ncbi:MAG: lipopolysaccharide kinase InaA family protein [Bacillota bacterium]
MSQLKRQVEDKIEKYKNKEQGKLMWVLESYDNVAFKNHLSQLDSQPPRGEIVDDGRNDLIKWSTAGEDVMVKKFNLTRTYDKIRFCMLDSKAVRSLRIALALEEIGVKTPKPIAVVEKRGSFNQLLYSYYLTEYVDYDYNLLNIVADDNHPRRDQVKEILPGIAQDVRKMHERGIIHNDLHAGNILIKDIDANPEFYYIDLNRGRIKNKLSTKQRIKDLARFDFTKEEQEIFMKYYTSDREQELLDKMRQQREKRRKFLNWKRSIRSKLKFWQ